MTELIETDSIININDQHSFIVCCFYTESYHEHAMRLKSSLDKFSLSYYFSQVEDAGYWEANTRLKPHFVMECLNKFPEKDVLYLDADAIVKQPIDYFNNVTADVAFYKTKGMPGMSHDYLASTMFFKNTEPTKALVQQWITEQVDGKNTQVDQDSLDQAMIKFENKISVEPLPAGYIKIFDKDYEGEIYIEQYQASRSQTKLRRQKIRQRNRVVGVVLLGAVLVATYVIAG